MIDIDMIEVVKFAFDKMNPTQLKRIAKCPNNRMITSGDFVDNKLNPKAG